MMAEGLPGEVALFDGGELVGYGVFVLAEGGVGIVFRDEGDGFEVDGADVFALDELDEVGFDGFGEVADGAAPGFGVDGASGCPAFVGEVDDGFGEGGVEAFVDSFDAVEGPVDEEGFEDHLVPLVVGKVGGGEGVVEGDGVVDLDDVGAESVDGGFDEVFGMWQDGVGGVDGLGLSNVGGAE